MAGQTVDEKKRALLEAFREGMTVLEAARRVGVGTTTVYRWTGADPEFAAAVEDAKDRADDAVEAVTFTNCVDPDPAHNTLRIFWLKSRRPEVFNRPQQIQVTEQKQAPHAIPECDPRLVGADQHAALEGDQGSDADPGDAASGPGGDGEDVRDS